MPNPQSKNIDAGTRLQALALAEHGVPRKQITAITDVASPTIGRYQRQARERGYNPQVSRHLLLAYVLDKPRSGRPRKGGMKKDGDGEKGGDGDGAMEEEEAEGGRSEDDTERGREEGNAQSGSIQTATQTHCTVLVDCNAGPKNLLDGDENSPNAGSSLFKSVDPSSMTTAAGQ